MQQHPAVPSLICLYSDSDPAVAVQDHSFNAWVVQAQPMRTVVAALQLVVWALVDSIEQWNKLSCLGYIGDYCILHSLMWLTYTIIRIPIQQQVYWKVGVFFLWLNYIFSNRKCLLRISCICIHLYTGIYMYLYSFFKVTFWFPSWRSLKPQNSNKVTLKNRIVYILFVPLWTPLNYSKLIQSWCPKVQDEPLAQRDTIYWVLLKHWASVDSWGEVSSLSSAAFGGGMGQVTHGSIDWYHGKLIHFNGIYQDFHGGFSGANCFFFREGNNSLGYGLVKQVPRWVSLDGLSNPLTIRGTGSRIPSSWPSFSSPKLQDSNWSLRKPTEC